MPLTSCQNRSVYSKMTASVDLAVNSWDHLALWVSVFAALAGAAAAFAAWRAVIVSERQQDYDRAERRIAQAQLIYGELEAQGPQVYLKVTNASAYPVSGVCGLWRRGESVVKTIEASYLIAGGEFLRLEPQMETSIALDKDARFEISFTDIAGVRWKRIERARPVEVI